MYISPFYCPPDPSKYYPCDIVPAWDGINERCLKPIVPPGEPDAIPSSRLEPIVGFAP